MDNIVGSRNLRVSGEVYSELEEIADYVYKKTGEDVSLNTIIATALKLARRLGADKWGFATELGSRNIIEEKLDGTLVV